MEGWGRRVSVFHNNYRTSINLTFLLTLSCIHTHTCISSAVESMFVYIITFKLWCTSLTRCVCHCVLDCYLSVLAGKSTCSMGAWCVCFSSSVNAPSIYTWLYFGVLYIYIDNLEYVYCIFICSGCI